MSLLILDDIISATGGKVICGKNAEFAGLSIDSRTIGNGELFVALRGDNFDGHDFIYDALKTGGGAVVSVPPVHPLNGKTFIHVGDTLKALQDIARFLRQKKACPVIGVTGTNGKTTTKELIASILSVRHRVLKTEGNLNNHIGLPLCISRMKGDETVMVLEMGSNVEGDINLLCDISMPDMAVVTNVGPAHLEGFGSLEKVRDTDLEILNFVKTAAFNADDLFLLEGTRGYKGKVITYGLENRAEVHAKDISLGEKGSRFILCLPGKREIAVELKIGGRINVLNALAAASIADETGMTPEEIRQGLGSFTGVPMRLEIRELPGMLLIRDVYNANPASVEEALKELIRLRRRRTVAVLGDMLELGKFSADAHASVVGRMSELGVDVFIAVGEEMGRASSEFRGECYKVQDSDAARTLLSGICTEGDTILVKGSRGMRMEKVIPAEGLIKREGAGHDV